MLVVDWFVPKSTKSAHTAHDACSRLDRLIEVSSLFTCHPERNESFSWIRFCPKTRAIWRPTTRLSDTRSMTCSSHGHSLTETRGSVINAANLLYCNVLYMPDDISAWILLAFGYTRSGGVCVCHFYITSTYVYARTGQWHLSSALQLAIIWIGEAAAQRRPGRTFNLDDSYLWLDVYIVDYDFRSADCTVRRQRTEQGTARGEQKRIDLHLCTV
jgi:hypothetical protein